MRRGTAGAVLVLTAAGLVLLLAGGVGVFAGLALAERIHALLPDEVTSDPAAIGGAALALGAVLLLAGGLHLALAPAVRAGRWIVGGIVVSAVMAALAVGWSITAAVSAAAGTAPAAGMLPAAIGLGLAAVAYGWSASVLMRARRAGRGEI
jgi:hypothetical protein